MIKKIILFLIASLIFLPNLLVSGQINPNGDITPPNTEDFPFFYLYCNVYGQSGEFLHNLQKDQFRITENDIEIVPSEVEESIRGMQLTIAFNLDQSMGIRDGLGNSRLDYVLDALRTWAISLQREDFDDVSIISNTENYGSHLTSYRELIETITSLDVNPREATGNMDVLARAVDIASEQTPRSGMDKAILFITPPPDYRGISALQNIQARAEQMGVRVFIWMVTSSQLFFEPEADSLRNLSTLTRGNFFAFSGTETLPSLETYFDDLRYAYQVKYKSAITYSGEHTAQLSITLENQTKIFDSPLFSLDVQPPNPIILSPPLDITRKVSSSVNEDTPKLIPEQTNINMLVEFPDGHERKLVRTLLYIDGEIAAENVKEPFTTFEWDLSQFTISGSHSMWVEALDNIGLTGKSIETPIRIHIEEAGVGSLNNFADQWLLYLSIFLTFLVTVIILSLVASGQIHPKTQEAIQSREKRTESLTKTSIPDKGAIKRQLQMEDDLNSVDIDSGIPYTPTLAVMYALNEVGMEIENKGVSIYNDVTTIGRDRNIVDVYLDDPSIAALHSIIVKQPDNKFKIFDEGSITGTWVNYKKVPSDGSELTTGDTIHFGRLGFKYCIESDTASTD